MARQRKSAPIESDPASAENHSGDESQQASQDQVTLDAMKSARNVMSADKKRREMKRKAVEHEHEKRMTDLKERMEGFFEGRRMMVMKLQSTQWGRLNALNKRRYQIEGQIIASIKSIETHTANISSSLAAMYAGRIEEIEELDENGI